MIKAQRQAAHFSGGRRTRHLGRAVLLCVFALFLTGVSTVGFGYVRLQGNIKQHNVEDYLGNDRPTIPADNSAGRALNILLIGSDVRSGDSDIDGAGQSGNVEGMRGDATMLLHISADRTRIAVISIPRDLLVNIPSCVVLDAQGKNQSTTAAQRNARFNSAFSLGGSKGNVGTAAACTMQTVEAMTGIRLDGFMVANFAAFKNTVDSIGGIPMYFAENMTDARAGLNIAAGCRLVDGTQALALARARYQLGDGSDIGRIGRQQELVMAIIREAMKLNLFSDMGSLYKVLDSVTNNLETSSGLGNIPRLAGLAGSLRNISLSNVTFMTMPFEYAGNVVVQRAGTEALWKALINDTPIDMTVGPYGEIIKKEPAASTSPTPGANNNQTPGTSSASSAASTTPASDKSSSPAPADPAATCSRETAK